MPFFKDLNSKVVLRSAIVLLLFGLFYYFLLQFITDDTVKNFANDHKILGVVVIIFYVVLSHIFAPIAGSPGTLLSVGLYGVWPTIFILYTASMISGNINFWISRKYGRNLVQKLVGAKSMHEIDQFVEASELKLLIISRLFGFALFDIISYAFGLTTVPYRHYMAITAVVGIIPGLTMGLLFNNVDFNSTRNILLWGLWIVVAGGGFGIFIKKMIKKRKHSNSS